ncbi:uncharacterized protein ACIBXB_013710 [Morphnus guianensis]
MRNKTKSQNTFPPPLPSSRAQLHSQILYLTPPAAQGDREWGSQSVHHTLSLPLHPLQGQDSSHSSPAPAWGPSHSRQSSTNFSNVGPSHGLQFFTNCSSMRPFHGVQSFRSTLAHCSSVGPPQGHNSCSVGSSLPTSTGPARSLLQRGLPTGSQPPSGIPLLRCGVLHGLQVDICSTMDLPGLQGDSLPHHGLHHHGLQGNLCSGIWSTSSSSSSFFTDLGVCRVVSLTCSHFSLRLAFLCVLELFFLLKYVIPEALPLSLIGSAVAGGRSILEPAGMGSLEHRGSFQHLLTEATPVTPPATKTLPHKPNTIGHNKFL